MIDKLSLKVDFSNFRNHIQDKKPFLIQNAIAKNSLSWNNINEIIGRADIVSDDFKIAYQGIIAKEKYVEQYIEVGTLRYRLLKPVVYHLLNSGATLIANKIINEPKLEKFVRAINDLTGRQTVTSMYVAFGDKDSYKAHWDTRDVYAIQLIGKKHWSLYKPNFENPLYMQQAKDMDIEEPTIPDMEVVLEAGDILYIPRGWWHNPVPMDCETFHLAAGTFAPTGYDYIEWLMKKFPNISSIRHNLDDWQYDLHNLNATASAITDMIADRENYDRFMQDYFAQHRIDSSFNMQIFGNNNADDIPLDAFVRLNAVDTRTIDKGYIIANGTKVNIDESSRKLLSLVSSKYQITLDDIVNQMNNIDEIKVGYLVYNLAMLDILEIIQGD